MLSITENIVTTSRFKFQTCNENQVTINNKTYNQSLLITQDLIQCPWVQHADINQLNKDDFKTILQDKPEILLIGTGSGFQRLPSTLQIMLYENKIIFETMKNDSACRSYLALNIEERSCCLALLLQPPSHKENL